MTKFTRYLLTLVLLLTSAGAALMKAQAGDAQGRTLWEGVYTDVQATRARSTFDEVCGSCHTLSSEGKGPLTGEKFWEGFAQRSVADLLDYVSTSMPNGRGGTLPASTYNDLVALILKSNGFPAGKTELGPETIANVQIIPKDGPGELPANALVRVVGCLTRNGTDWVLTSATSPQRIEGSGVGPEDARRPLGAGTIALKFLLTRLDPFVGQRLSVSGILIGTGGANGLNVTTVNRVAETCP